MGLNDERLVLLDEGTKISGACGGLGKQKGKQFGSGAEEEWEWELQFEDSATSNLIQLQPISARLSLTGRTELHSPHGCCPRDGLAIQVTSSLSSSTVDLTMLRTSSADFTVVTEFGTISWFIGQ